MCVASYTVITVKTVTSVTLYRLGCQNGPVRIYQRHVKLYPVGPGNGGSVDVSVAVSVIVHMTRKDRRIKPQIDRGIVFIDPQRYLNRTVRISVGIFVHVSGVFGAHRISFGDLEPDGVITVIEIDKVVFPVGVGRDDIIFARIGGVFDRISGTVEQMDLHPGDPRFVGVLEAVFVPVVPDIIPQRTADDGDRQGVGKNRQGHSGSRSAGGVGVVVASQVVLHGDMDPELADGLLFHPGTADTDRGHLGIVGERKSARGDRTAVGAARIPLTPDRTVA